MQSLPLGIYQHYKGPKYRVLGVVRHSETLEELVHYECLYDNPGGQFWGGHAPCSKARCWWMVSKPSASPISVDSISLSALYG